MSDKHKIALLAQETKKLKETEKKLALSNFKLAQTAIQLASQRDELAQINKKISTDSNNKINKLQCPNCNKTFKHASSLSRHKKRFCKEKTTADFFSSQEKNNINNINTLNQNIKNTTNNTNTINIVFNINSIEEAQAIKAILTPEKILSICDTGKKGLPLQSYDIVKNIQSLSLESKKNNPELVNFKKTNARDNIIDVFDGETFQKVDFKKYNISDLHKFARSVMRKCEEEEIEPEKSYDEKLELICEVLRNYDDFEQDRAEHGTIDFIMRAVEECEREAKLQLYNITQKQKKLKEKEERKKVLLEKLQRLEEKDKEESDKILGLKQKSQV